MLDDARREAEGLDTGGDAFAVVVAEFRPNNPVLDCSAGAEAGDGYANGFTVGERVAGSVNVATVAPEPGSEESDIRDAVLLFEPNTEPRDAWKSAAWIC